MKFTRKEELINDKVPLTFQYVVLDGQAFVSVCDRREELSSLFYGIQTPYEKGAIVEQLISAEESESELEERTAMVARLVKKTGMQVSLSINIDQSILKTEDYLMPTCERLIREELIN